MSVRTAARTALGIVGAAVIATGCGGAPPAPPAAGAEVRVPDVAGAPPGPAAGAQDTELERECDALISIINAGVERLETDPDDGDPVAEIHQMAETMRDVSRQVAALDLETPELSARADDYARMASQTADAADEVAAAAESGDVARVTEAQRGLEEAVLGEDELVDRINALCPG